ncbi:MAG: Asp-tRNA(Asn)/Glu-tRNA(Gln) amidotransferase subunit GatC [Candidatus Moranbacteria bacterium]|jgi:aspartyl-tRNA(Asn)/glutamyl-tRNA(Gln) amidotransferase subunit C|nr:Asp-tRNA(Asn)/Glu-tRNA(Gln) amidotransferase subunit GatC [Candidatus Moranbacteria bacterium]MDD5651930.1 Asp-tRNA(Asn)/Glu-tRNA(Gln) amidotransferase subunit GatC [Candidatus Moranbacteria bacterium]MDX9855378.1 Asp-tRNA(Asn)/Glu-tRNA(Gln) amidotransferase subunit GatC [Candidatus Moranbacteria bacterium]
MLEKEEIKHIATLARIGLKEKEIEKYQKELSQVLDYFKKLENLDTEKTEPIVHITGMHSVLRDDKAEECGKETEKMILKNAPEEKDGYFKVKSVF